MYKLLSSVITPLDSVHNCTVHHCVLNNTVDSKNVHPGHLQPMGEQLPKINITNTPYIDSLTFYDDYYKPFSNFEQTLEWKKLNNIYKDVSVPLSIMGDRSYRASEERYPYHHELINSVLDMRDSIGISRRTLYLLVLAFTIH